MSEILKNRFIRRTIPLVTTVALGWSALAASGNENYARQQSASITTTQPSCYDDDHAKARVLIDSSGHRTAQVERMSSHRIDVEGVSTCQPATSAALLEFSGRVDDACNVRDLQVWGEWDPEEPEAVMTVANSTCIKQVKERAGKRPEKTLLTYNGLPLAEAIYLSKHFIGVTQPDKTGDPHYFFDPNEINTSFYNSACMPNKIVDMSANGKNAQLMIVNNASRCFKQLR